MKGISEKTEKLFFLVLLSASMLLVALNCFAAPPIPPKTPVPLMGEEILIPMVVGYGIHRLRNRNK